MELRSQFGRDLAKRLKNERYPHAAQDTKIMSLPKPHESLPPRRRSRHDARIDRQAACAVVVRATALPGDLDQRVFARAAALVAAETDALRPRIHERQAGLGQSALPSAGPDIPFVDLSVEPDPGPAAERRLLQAGRQILEPTATQPFAWTLMRLAPSRMIWGQAYHPSAIDPIGQELVVARVGEVYTALIENRPVPCLKDQVSLAELTAREHAYLASDRAASDLAWCVDQCAGLPQPPSPSRHPPTADLSSQRITRTLDAAVATQLTSLSRGLRVTRPQLLCAAWAALLSRLTYQDDFLLGLAVSGRYRAARRTPASLAHLMPLRLTGSADEPFAAWAIRVARQMRAALRRQRVPQATLLHGLGLSLGDPDPLSVVFDHRPYRTVPEIAGRVMLGRVLVPGPVQDLGLSVEAGSDGDLILHLDANRDRYEPAETNRLIERLLLLLDGLLVSGDQAGSVRLGDLVVMTDQERAVVTGPFSCGPPAPPQRTLLDLLAAEMRTRPRALALAAVSAKVTTCYSYAELDDFSNRLGRYLLARGLASGDTVAVLLPRNADLIATLLACVKAGIAYCPLDPAQPSVHLMQACGARLLLTDCAHAKILATDTPLLLLDAADTCDAINEMSGEAITNEERGAPVHPSDIAYVIFTSGSTGFPKGVAVSHGAIAQQLQAAQLEVKLQRGQTVMAVTSIAFDPATLEIFLALSHGAVLALLDDESRRDPNSIYKAIVAHEATLLVMTPGVLRTLPLEALPAALTIVCGGEPFPAELVPRMRQLRAVINAYGPTEAAVITTVHRLDLDNRADAAIPIGRPMAGYRVWILDRTMSPMPIGALGELCIGGGALAVEYVGQPALTAAAFPPNPFGEGKIYRTGDLARWRPDGVIELHGRIDDQVKILGHRVEPAEVEHAMRALPWVADVAILPYGEPPRVKLVAYTVPRSGERIPPLSTIRDALADHLPDWMLPAALVPLPTLPRTAMGKLDRKALPPVPSAPARGIGHRRPQSPDEALLCGLFARITGHAAVDVDTDFFEIGGDSLAAMVLITELGQLGRDLPLTRLFDAPTPGGIAKAWSSSAPFVSASARPTLFVIPGAGGDGPALAALRREWANTLNCVLLEYPDWPQWIAPNFGMNDVVTDIVARMRDHTPPGPLLLAGYSAGGLVAFAVAQYLAAAGRPVDVLFILDYDTNIPALGVQSAHQGKGFIRRLSDLVAARGTGGGPGRQRMLGEFIAYRIIEHPALLRLLARFRHLRLPSEMRYWLRLTLCWNLHVRACQLWEAQATPSARLDGGKVVLLRAAEQEDPQAAPDLGWRARCRELRLETIEGDHESMLNKRGSNSLYKKLPKILAELVGEQITK